MNNNLNTQELVKLWFEKWEQGDYLHLPITADFKHTSPFGTTYSRKQYLAIVEANEAKFLGYRFNIHDQIYGDQIACVRYTGLQGEFTLDVSEWFYVRENLFEQIISYFHIGEIQQERNLGIG